MRKAKVRVAGKLGIHARLAYKFAVTSARYKSSIKVSRNDVRGNGKDIMDVLSLGTGPGDCVVIEVNGEDESEAMESLTRILGKENGGD